MSGPLTFLTTPGAFNLIVSSDGQTGLFGSAPATTGGTLTEGI
jgi:hypothetical protein